MQQQAERTRYGYPERFRKAAAARVLAMRRGDSAETLSTIATELGVSVSSLGNWAAWYPNARRAPAKKRGRR